jgi:hypothetical protein
MSLGALRHSIMAVGHMREIAGAGSPAQLRLLRSMPLLSLPSSVAEDLVSASALDLSRSDGSRLPRARFMSRGIAQARATFKT